MRLREPMPELDGATGWLNGQVAKVDLVGVFPTVIHFWSVSCHSCKEAMVEINRLRSDYSGRLNFVAVHMPRSQQDLNPDNVKKVALEHGISHPIFVDNEHKLTNIFGNKYVPAYYLFDKDGKLRHFQAGRGSIKMLEERVNRLINDIKSS